MRGDSGEAPSAPPAPAVGVRPIAIGSILQLCRLAVRLLLARDRSDVEAALGKAHNGFTPSGRESIMAQISTLLPQLGRHRSRHPQRIQRTVSRSRLTMLEECRARSRLPQPFALARGRQHPYLPRRRRLPRFRLGRRPARCRGGLGLSVGVLFALAYRSVLGRLHARGLSRPPRLLLLGRHDATGPADLVARAI